MYVLFATDYSTENQLCYYKKNKYINVDETLFTNIKSFDGKEYICKTCHSKVLKGKIPCQAIYNNMYVDKIPAELVAAIEVMVKIALTIIAILAIKKPSLLTSNSICYSDISEDDLAIKDYHITVSIWNYKQERGINLRPISALMILLLLAGDIETCPGPCLKCNSCQKTIRKNQTLGCCSTCGNQLHMNCLLDMTNRQGKEKLYCSTCVPIKDDL